MPLKQDDFRKNHREEGGDEISDGCSLWFLRFIFAIPGIFLVVGMAFAFSQAAFMWVFLEAMFLIIIVYIEATVEANVYKTPRK